MHPPPAHPWPRFNKREMGDDASESATAVVVLASRARRRVTKRTAIRAAIASTSTPSKISTRRTVELAVVAGLAKSCAKDENNGVKCSTRSGTNSKTKLALTQPIQYTSKFCAGRGLEISRRFTPRRTGSSAIGSASTATELHIADNLPRPVRRRTSYVAMASTVVQRVHESRRSN
jgi:hypothetical protein